MNSGLRIRSMTAEDLPGVLATAEKALNESYPLGKFGRWLQRSPDGFVIATMGDVCVGFAVAVHARGDTRLLLLFVDEEYRRGGIAHKIMGQLLLRLYNGGCEHILLEVRESNHGAIAFYKSIGFQTEGMIRRYYTSGENAMIMGKELR